MPDTRMIKKYPNRRLYDTQTSTYITVTDVKQLVLDQEDFKVIDAKSGDDLTRAILLQIILEEESGGKPIFSANVLSNIIRFYGHAMQGMMGMYLEKNVQAFLDIQDRMAEQSKALFTATGKGPQSAAGNADAWAQFMNFQGPMMQGMMSNYIEQSKNMFLQMQDQFQNQAKTMFTGFPFPGQEPPKK
ncbi:MAG: polyhydroxyalkanoate biosynthesis repressor PhaR [Betaproteobacteria bacterium]|nr:polyhydroxyalkanoate biosynthesis repressor PhaR [Betaproteobacteria bacterium]